MRDQISVAGGTLNTYRIAARCGISLASIENEWTILQVHDMNVYLDMEDDAKILAYRK